jgi:hypothetical protein
VVSSFVPEIHHHRALMALRWVCDGATNCLQMRIRFHSEFADKTTGELGGFLVSAHLAMPNWPFR